VGVASQPRRVPEAAPADAALEPHDLEALALGASVRSADGAAADLGEHGRLTAVSRERGRQAAHVGPESAELGRVRGRGDGHPQPRPAGHLRWVASPRRPWTATGRGGVDNPIGRRTIEMISAQSRFRPDAVATEHADGDSVGRARGVATSHVGAYLAASAFGGENTDQRLVLRFSAQTVPVMCFRPTQ